MKRIILVAAGLAAVGASTAVLLLRRRAAAKRAEANLDFDAIIDEVVVHFEPFDEPLGAARY